MKVSMVILFVLICLSAVALTFSWVPGYYPVSQLPADYEQLIGTTNLNMPLSNWIVFGCVTQATFQTYATITIPTPTNQMMFFAIRDVYTNPL